MRGSFSALTRHCCNWRSYVTSILYNIIRHCCNWRSGDIDKWYWFIDIYITSILYISHTSLCRSKGGLKSLRDHFCDVIISKKNYKKILWKVMGKIKKLQRRCKWGPSEGLFRDINFFFAIWHGKNVCTGWVGGWIRTKYIHKFIHR